MNMENPEEEVILDDNEDKYDVVINEEEVYCTGVRRYIRQSRSVEIIRKERKNIFEDDIPNMKTDMNHDLLTQTIEKSKRTE